MVVLLPAAVVAEILGAVDAGKVGGTAVVTIRGAVVIVGSI